jgi:hypothetical protein
MKKLKIVAVSFATLLLLGCQTAPPRNFPPPQDYVPVSQITIPPKFTLAQLSKDNLDAEARRCVITLPQPATSVENLKNRWPLPSNQSVAFGHASSASVYVVARGQGYCVRSSENKYPIIAAEGLNSTANPNGVPPDVLTGWHQKIAMQLAINGSAHVAYAGNNGNAFIVKYWFADQSPKYSLSYSNDFKRAGSWENEKYDFVFKDKDIQGFGVTERSGRKNKPEPLAQ